MGRAGVAPHTCPDIAAAEWPTLMMMTMAKGIAAAPARARPTHADGHRPVFEGRGPTNNATAMRNRRFQKSLSALEMEHGRRVGEIEAVLPLLL